MAAAVPRQGQRQVSDGPTFNSRFEFNRSEFKRSELLTGTS